MDDLKEALEGFNAGYILEQKRPTLAQSINKTVKDADDPFFQGFQEGSAEYSKEKARSKFLGKLKGGLGKTPKAKDKNLDKGLDKDI